MTLSFIICYYKRLDVIPDANDFLWSLLVNQPKTVFFTSHP